MPAKLTMSTSVGFSPAFFSAPNKRYCVMVPVAMATFLPSRSATVLIEDSGLTMIAYDDALGSTVREAATTLIGLPAACAKTVGVSAMKPRSTEPPFIAAMTAGPPTNVLHSMSYGTFLSSPAAVRMLWTMFSWSPKCRVTPDRSAPCLAECCSASGRS